MSRFTASPGHTATPRRRAVVLGASMAGLSAAAVLASRFDEVVIVERDELPDEPGDRRGVPQGRHAHGLLPAGLERLEGWFPGLTEELVAGGARYLDVGADVLWHQGGGFRHRFQSGVKGPVCSRALLEHHVRQRVLALPNVSLRQGAAAAGVTTTPDASTVTGVTLDDGTTLPADLVVDATGRAARSLRWLTALGYEEPPTSVVTVDVGYASRILRRDTRQDTDWGFLLVLSEPPSGRWGAALPLEGDRWIVTLTGCHGDHPPTDDAGFLAFARSLPTPEVAELLETATPLTPVRTHRTHSSQRRHVERLRRVPGGLVMLGDAVCSFNPTYGQGMSTAALQAEALGQALDATPTLDQRFVRRFYRRAAKAVTPAWQLTTGADFALPQTSGSRPPGTDLLNRYMAHVFRASQVSDEVCLRVIEVTALLKPPQALLTPRMVATVVRAARRAPTTTTATTPTTTPTLAPTPTPAEPVVDEAA